MCFEGVEIVVHCKIPPGDLSQPLRGTESDFFSCFSFLVGDINNVSRNE